MFTNVVVIAHGYHDKETVLELARRSVGDLPFYTYRRETKPGDFMSTWYLSFFNAAPLEPIRDVDAPPREHGSRPWDFAGDVAWEARVRRHLERVALEQARYRGRSITVERLLLDGHGREWWTPSLLDSVEIALAREVGVPVAEALETYLARLRAETGLPPLDPPSEPSAGDQVSRLDRALAWASRHPWWCAAACAPVGALGAAGALAFGVALGRALAAWTGGP